MESVKKFVNCFIAKNESNDCTTLCESNITLIQNCKCDDILNIENMSQSINSLEKNGTDSRQIIKSAILCYNDEQSQKWVECSLRNGINNMLEHICTSKDAEQTNKIEKDLDSRSLIKKIAAFTTKSDNTMNVSIPFSNKTKDISYFYIEENLIADLFILIILIVFFGFVFMIYRRVSKLPSQTEIIELDNISSNSSIESNQVIYNQLYDDVFEIDIKNETENEYRDKLQKKINHNYNLRSRMKM